MHEMTRKLINECACERIIIFVDGLFGLPPLMMLPLFNGYRKEVTRLSRATEKAKVAFKNYPRGPKDAFRSYKSNVSFE
jgi:hypothetical protein